MFAQFDPVTLIRLEIFGIIILLLMSLEWLLPKRNKQQRGMRWLSNLSVSVINVGALAVLSLSAVAASLYALEMKFGLFYQWHLALWPQIIVTILILDFVIYWQHRFFHTRGPLWALHRMHHTDSVVDVTTALRFHPFEIIVSMVLKCAVILLLGAPLLGVILFEILLNAAAMFNHSNIRLSKSLDKLLRLFIVTPDMHRVHHSQIFKERNTNYSFFLSIWDRAFGTYCAQPSLGHEKMQIGLKDYQSARENYLHVMLTQPLRKAKPYGNSAEANE